MANFQLIRTISKSKGMTLAELAEQIGITPAGISTIINTNSTNTKTIEQIARVLEVKVGVFFDEPDPAEETPQDLYSIIEQKDAIIAQKDKLIEQKDAVIRILAEANANNHKLA